MWHCVDLNLLWEKCYNIFSLYSQMTSVCCQINTELFFTLLVHFCWFSLTHRHNNAYVISVYFLCDRSYQNPLSLLERKVQFKESILFFILITVCRFIEICELFIIINVIKGTTVYLQTSI
jgi:hypothetical protein